MPRSTVASIRMPKTDVDMIERRLKAAQTDYQVGYGQVKSGDTIETGSGNVFADLGLSDAVELDTKCEWRPQSIERLMTFLTALGSDVELKFTRMRWGIGQGGLWCRRLNDKSSSPLSPLSLKSILRLGAAGIDDPTSQDDPTSRSDW